MEIKKEAIFRVQILEVKTGKSKVLTVYGNGDNPSLDSFKEMISIAIKGDKK